MPPENSSTSSRAVTPAGASFSPGLSTRPLTLKKRSPCRPRRPMAAYFAAGASVAIAASYQASVPGFVAAGIGEDEAVRLIGSSVRVAQRVRDDHEEAP